MSETPVTDNNGEVNPDSVKWEDLAEPASAEQLKDEARSRAIQELGSRLHDTWRASRALGDGAYEPREKSTSDQLWTKEHGVDVVDIANTDFVDLPQDWKRENKDAATVVVDLFYRYGVPEVLATDRGEEKFKEKVRMLASQVHAAWLERDNNSWAKGGELDVPFDELPVGEQQKDIDQIMLGIGLANSDQEEVWREERGSYQGGDLEIIGYNQYNKVVYWDMPDYDDDDGESLN